MKPVLNIIVQPIGSTPIRDIIEGVDFIDDYWIEQSEKNYTEQYGVLCVVINAFISYKE